MTSYSRVAVSIFVISVMLLPAVYILGILLPPLLYNTFMFYFGELSDFFTVLGIILLVMTLGPPYDRKKLAWVARKIKRYAKNFFWPKNTEEVVFRDDIIHFTATEDISKDLLLQIEIIDYFFKSKKVGTLNYLL